ncbi:GGDEF domain-containing protein [Acinetobacter sp. ANC 3813]|uniref:GGDEF domain-containing protein n=1 Tax=Acinetobacter sp. ANC 3813 TaxID=1977873 RepID=UPI000A33D55D|nr:GGDEF domain-containing protein [Acinetobacter sp. ANC 3813]OTG91569.1 GGDEF domain-containing protein [Acinetobacter sp. ANC 3813]
MKLEGSKLLSRNEIQALISRGLNYVYFSKTLEPVYKRQYQHEAALEFRFRAPIILILYLFLSYGIYQNISSGTQFVQWFALYAWVGVIIFAAWLISFIRKFDQYFELYAGAGCSAAVAISFIIIPVVNNNNDALLHAAMMYAVVIIYGFVGLRFYTALSAGWLGGLIAIFITNILNYPIDWTFLNRTYTFSSFLGMALAYAIDRQHRENYLQNCIIELNKLEMAKQSEQLELLTQLDALTGLANRRHLTAVLDKHWNMALRYQMPISILMIDIDCFKEYNDHLGHIAGDFCLQKIANELQAVTSRSTDLAARYGGEEFLLLFPLQEEKQIEKIASKLLERITDLALPHPSSKISPYVTISIGAATIIPQEHDELSEFIQSADQALYLAKTNGRNQYYVAKKDVA